MLAQSFNVVWKQGKIVQSGSLSLPYFYSINNKTAVCRIELNETYMKHSFSVKKIVAHYSFIHNFMT